MDIGFTKTSHCRFVHFCWSHKTSKSFKWRFLFVCKQSHLAYFTQARRKKCFFFFKKTGFINRLACCSVQSLLLLFHSLLFINFFLYKSMHYGQSNTTSVYLNQNTNEAFLQPLVPEHCLKAWNLSVMCAVLRFVLHITNDNLAVKYFTIWYLCYTKICLLLKSNLKKEKKKRSKILPFLNHNQTVEILPVSCVSCRLLTPTPIIYVFAAESFSLQAWIVIVLTVVMNSDIFQSSLTSGTTHNAFSSHPSGRQVSVPPVSNHLHRYELIAATAPCLGREMVQRQVEAAVEWSVISISFTS